MTGMRLSDAVSATVRLSQTQQPTTSIRHKAATEAPLVYSPVACP